LYSFVYPSQLGGLWKKHYTVICGASMSVKAFFASGAVSQNNWEVLLCAKAPQRYPFQAQIVTMLASCEI
jgi:hypothetical protein